MIGRRVGIALVALAMASAGCQPAVQEAGPLSDADMAAIRGVFDSLGELEQASDWDGVAGLFAEDIVLMMPDQPAMEGVAAWRAMIDAVQPVVHALSADIAEIDGRADLAFVRGTYTETSSFAGAEEPQEFAGKFLWVLEKQPDGRWLVTVGISNSDGPPADTGM